MEQIFSCFERIRQSDVDSEARVRGASELPKSIYTARHRKLCELLKLQRKAAGLTQTIVAERLGKAAVIRRKYEGGDRRLNVLELIDVAAAIGFDACKLIRALRSE